MLTVQSETLMNVDRLFLRKYDKIIAAEPLNWTRVAVKYFLMRTVLGDRDIAGGELVTAVQETKACWVEAGLPEISWFRVNQFLLYLEQFSQHPIHALNHELQRMLEQNYVEIQYSAHNLVFNQYQVVRATDLLMSHALLEPFNAAS